MRLPGQRCFAAGQHFHVLFAGDIAQQLSFDLLGRQAGDFTECLIVFMHAQVAVEMKDRRGQCITDHAHAFPRGTYPFIGDAGARLRLCQRFAQALKLPCAADDQPFGLGGLTRHRGN